MEKAGWQIATAVCGSLALMMGALAFNSARSLEVANIQLRERAPTVHTEAPPSAAIADYRSAEQELFRASNRELLRTHPDVLKCIDGKAFAKINGEWSDNGPC